MPRKTRRRALVVGVSTYTHRKITNLHYAHRDAEAFADFLRSPSGGEFGHDEIRVLANATATHFNLKAGISEFLAKSREDDPVTFFFSGHGRPDPGRPNNVYLLCYDSDPAALYLTAFPLWHLDDSLDRLIPSRKVLVLLDCCRAGAVEVGASAKGGGAEGPTRSRIIARYWSPLSRVHAGISLITATDADTQGFEDLRWGDGHGVFTHCLLEGLRGGALRRGAESVTANAVFDYLLDAVSRETGDQQRPWRSAHLDDEIPLSRPPRPLAPPIPAPVPVRLTGDIRAVPSDHYDLHFEAGVRLSVEAERADDMDRAEELWQKVQRELSLTLSYRETADAQQRLVEARRKLAMISGERFAASNQFRAAKEAFEEALLNGDGTVIRRRIADMERRIEEEARRVDVLADARRAMRDTDWEEAVKLLEQGRQLAPSDEVTAWLAEARFQLALKYRKAGHDASRSSWLDAIRFYELTEEHLRAANDLGRTEYAELAISYFDLFTAHTYLEQHDAALEWLRKAASATETAIAAGDEIEDFLAEIYLDIGGIHQSRQEYDAALECYAKAVTASEAAVAKGEEDENGLGVVYRHIAEVHHQREEYDLALQWYGKAVMASDAALAKSQGTHKVLAHINLGYTYAGIGQAHQDREEYDVALEWHGKAVTAFEAVLAVDSQDEDYGYSLSIAFHNLGMCHETLGHLNEAIEYFEKDVAILRRIKHPDLSEDMETLEALKLRAGRT